MLVGQDSGPVYHWVNSESWTAPASPTVDVPFGSVLNPWGVDVWVFPTSFFEITTESTGASTVDIGTNASATTKGDNVIDGASGAAAINLTGSKNAGTNGGGVIKWAAGTYLNIAEASGAVEGLVGVMHVIWSPVN